MATTTPFPEFRVSASMRAAASAVAACFHAYQQSCYDMPKAKDAKALEQLLIAQKERRNAYHLALKFLSTAALKENPCYDMSDKHTQQQRELMELMQNYLDKRLNQLISEESSSNHLIKNTFNAHPVMQGPW